MDSKKWTMAKLCRSKITDWLLNITGIIMLIVVGVLSYWHIRSYEVLEILDGNYSLEQREYYQGDAFPIRLRVCKHLPIKERIFGKFIDGVIFSVPDNVSNFDVGCYDTYLTGVRIPETLPEGNYVYREEVMYRVNPIQEIKYVFTTPEFRVVQRE